MVVCQYFLRGNCRFGTACRNEHPANPRSGFGNQSWSNNNNTTTNVQSPTKAPIALFTQDSLKSDLTLDKPIWPLSTFGPAKFEPNLVSNLDESMEELRVRAVIALKAGNVNEYTTYEAKKIEAANEVYNNARNNIAQVYQTALSQSSRSTTPSTSSPFTSTTNVTGYPSSPLKTNPFTAPTFGQSSFGVKPSTASSPSVFGQTSTLGGNKPGGGATTGGGFGAFAGGGTSSLASVAAAMKPSAQSGGGGGGAFAAFAGQQPSAFGAGAANNAGSVFGTGGPLGGGAPSTVFGQSQNQQHQPQQTTSAFGTIQNQPTSVFGQPPQAQAQPQQPPQQPQQGGGFGVFANQQQQPQSVFGGGGGGGGAPQQQQQQPQPQSSFGNPSQQPRSAFGAPQQQPGSAFGASQSVFGSTSTQPHSVFGGGGGGAGNPLNPPSVFSNSSNPFNASTSQPPPPTSQQQSAFSQTAAPNNPFTNTTNALTPTPKPTATATTTTTPTTTQNLLTNPTSKPDFLSILTRARPTPGISPYDKTLPPNYTEILPKHAVEAFKREKFEFGMVPDWVPPVELR